eukprot:jgi/Tetstr1/454095/TSEL_041014.t1
MRDYTIIALLACAALLVGAAVAGCPHRRERFDATQDTAELASQFRCLFFARYMLAMKELALMFATALLMAHLSSSDAAVRDGVMTFLMQTSDMDENEFSIAVMEYVQLHTGNPIAAQSMLFKAHAKHGYDEVERLGCVPQQ